MSPVGVAWNRFWFTPVPTASFDRLRIAVGFLVLASALLLVPDVGLFFAESSIGAVGAWLALAAVGIGALALIRGRRAGLGGLVALVGLIELERANPLIFNSGDRLLRVLLVIVLVGLGATRRRATTMAAWPLRLVQIQMAIVYASGVVYKLQGTTWWNGTAASYPLRIGNMARFTLPQSLVDSAGLAQVVSYGTLLVEAAFPVLVWFAATRRYVLAAGIVLHVSIDLLLRPGLFSYVMLAGYLAFVPTVRRPRPSSKPRPVSRVLESGMHRRTHRPEPSRSHSSDAAIRASVIGAEAPHREPHVAELP